jgi:Zn-dependent M32 family carboxypeptidase
MKLEDFEKGKELLEMQSFFEELEKKASDNLKVVLNRYNRDENSNIICEELQQDIKKAFENAYSKIDVLFEAL